MNRILGIATLAVMLILDQISKEWILGLLRDAPWHGIEVTSFFNLVLVWNEGISFGLLAKHDMPYVLVGLSLAIVGWLAHWLWKGADRPTTLALGLVIGGALGNVIDRVRFGAVVDFLDFHVAGVHWPSFNVADASIFVGVVVLCVWGMVCDIQSKRRK